MEDAAALTAGRVTLLSLQELLGKPPHTADVLGFLVVAVHGKQRLGHALKSPHLSARNFIARILPVINCFLFTETLLLLSYSSSSGTAPTTVCLPFQQTHLHLINMLGASSQSQSGLSLSSNHSCLETSPSDGHIYLPVKIQALEMTHWSIDRPPHKFKSIGAGNKRGLDKDG